MDEEDGRWANLPPELLHVIMDMLKWRPAVSRCFRLVSKQWLQVHDARLPRLTILAWAELPLGWSRRFPSARVVELGKSTTSVAADRWGSWAHRGARIPSSDWYYRRTRPHGLQVRDVQQLTRLTALTTLEMGDDVQIDLASMQEIGRLTTLTRLCLGGCSELVTDQGLKGVAPLTALTRLSLDAPPYSKLAVTDAGLVAARIPSLSLTHLDLRECAGVTLVHGELGSLTALTHLDLWGCYGVSDVGLRTLRELPLSTLTLRECILVSDDGLIDVLSGISTLHCLNLHYCPRITDVGVIALARLPALTKLGLRGTNVTATGRAAVGTTKCIY